MALRQAGRAVLSGRWGQYAHQPACATLPWVRYMSFQNPYDELRGIIGSHTPVTKELWSTARRSWTKEELEAASPPTDPPPKAPLETSITYPFRTNEYLREQVGFPAGIGV